MAVKLLEEEKDIKMKNSLVELFVEASNLVSNACSTFYNETKRLVYTTPKNFIDMIKLYNNLLNKKQEEY